ncbi:hypothetical protein Leryth_007472 [Lithospermum erythrorhizon]|nr:hypothetical protein Leryth_007472 [Lithospermum erythrorhizon]
MNHGVNLPPQHRIFFKKLLNFTHHKNLPMGQNLHAHLIKNGSAFSSTYLSNTISNFYVKCLLLHEAHLAFQDIQHKDVVSWNCLINGYAQTGLKEPSLSTIEVFKEMLYQEFLPNSHTFTGVFAAAAALQRPFVGKELHCVVVKLSECRDVYVDSALLNMYCKVGLVGDARKVFDDMIERNSVTWATMISGYALERRAVEAVEVFKMMVGGGEEGVNEYVFTGVLSAFALSEYLHAGRQIHCLAVKNGLALVNSVGNAVVTMYSKCGSVNDAFQAFGYSSDRNSITWSAMITGYAQSGDGLKALQLFSEMHLCGMKLSEYTLVGVLNACSDTGSLIEGNQVHSYVVKHGFESQMYILTALVDMYSKCGNVFGARKGFDYLQVRDIVLWTSMIGGYVQNGDYENAMIMYCRMQMEGIQPNELTLASVLKACSGLAALEQGRQLHSHTIKYGFGLEVPIGSALSTMYTKCGSLNDGDQAFRRMPSRDVFSWNAMLSGLSQNGRGVEALQLFEEMRLEGTQPDHVTFVNVLTACSHMGLVDSGWNYFKMMSDEFGIDPGLEHYACMVDILGRSGKLLAAKEFIESVHIDHGLCLWRILLSACRNYRNYELGAYAGERLMELQSQESSAYVLLASIYSAMGKLDDVERVRKLMSLRGVSKEPGCSWIELRNNVHVFVVGDLLHPLIEDIRTEIRRLTELMKDEASRPDYESTFEEFQPT